MPDKTRRRIGSVCLLLGLAVAMFILILTALHAVGTDDGLYYSEQMQAGILPTAGISDGDLRTLDAALAAYLAGDASKLLPDGENALPVTVFGSVQPAFNDREMTHMRDCLGLFALLRKVRARLIPWAILLGVGGAYLLQDRRRARLCAWLSPLVLMVPLGAFAIFAAIDFDAAFTFFHRMLFSNDLWLLDPRTDLLIRICPERMFAHMGARIALWSLIAMLAVSAAATALTFLWPKRKEENTWNNRDMRRASGQKQMSFGKKGTR